jgi:hypothetical protein
MELFCQRHDLFVQPVALKSMMEIDGKFPATSTEQIGSISTTSLALAPVREQVNRV